MQINNEAAGLLSGVNDLNPLGKLQELKEIINKFIILIKGNLSQIIRMYLIFIAKDITVILVNKFTSQFLSHPFDMHEQFNVIQTIFILNSISVIAFLQLFAGNIQPESIQKMKNQITALLIFQLVLFGIGCSYMIFLATTLYQISNPILFNVTVIVKSFQFGIYNSVIYYIQSRSEFQELFKQYQEAQLQIQDIQSKMKM